jgi:hypothetical protein
MCVVFAIFSMFLATNAAAITTIFIAIAGAFLTIAFVTSGPESRW